MSPVPDWGLRLRQRETVLQLHHPRLTDEVMTEMPPRLAVDQPETSLLVDVAGRDKDVHRPERDLRVTCLAGEPDALIDQPLAKPQPARFRLDQRQPQLGDRPGSGDEKDTANRPAVPLGDPATLARRVEPLDNAGDDLGHDRLELDIPAEFVRVQQS